MIKLLFHCNLAIHYAMLLGTVFSIWRPANRIWPPPGKSSWQYYSSWILFYTAMILTGLLSLLTWNTWRITTEIKFFIGLPMIILGSWFVSWGILTLGIKNTVGIRDDFIESGPYQFTRNPQYIGDIVLFIGVALFVNSIYATIPLLLQSIIFLIVPFAEETWLKERYGRKYFSYKIKTPRFL